MGDSSWLVRIFPGSLPVVRQELIDVGDWSRGEPGEGVLQVIEGIDGQPPAGLDEGHPYCCCVATLHRSGKEEIAPSKHCRPQAVFRVVIVRADKAGVCIEAESLPLILAICD